jgi:hypothetical protein
MLQNSSVKNGLQLKLLQFCRVNPNSPLPFHFLTRCKNLVNNKPKPQSKYTRFYKVKSQSGELPYHTEHKSE